MDEIMVENKRVKLNSIEELILKKLIIDSPYRPKQYEFASIYKKFDYYETDEHDVETGLDNLVTGNYIKNDNGQYSLTRNTFLELKKKYKIQLFFNNFLFKTLLVPIVLAILVSVLSGIFTGDFLRSPSSSTRSETLLESRVLSIEKQMQKYNSLFSQSNKNYDSLLILNEINVLSLNLSKISDNVQALNSLLQDNPERFVEIAKITNDLDELKTQFQTSNNSIMREVDRISSYNNTLIVFMITFLVAYIGIGIFTNLNRKKDFSNDTNI